MYWYGIDELYIILVLPAILLSLFAQIKVSSTFSKYNSVLNSRGITGSDIARRILDSNGLHSVAIEHIRGNLTDNYNPKSFVLSLSDSVYSSMSVASIGVAAHECSHAIQHSNGYSPLKIRNFVFPAVRISSASAVPVIILGLIFNAPFLISAGIILFSASVLFQIITLPVEFNASRRALSILRDSFELSSDEIKGVKKVLTAAALTYVASALVSAMQLLRLILISGNRRR